MKVIEFTQAETESSPVQRIVDQVRELLGMGDENQKAQEMVVARLKRGLDNRYTLLRNAILDVANVSIPLILVGPNGVTVFNVNAQGGVYQARDENWMEMSKATRRYQPARENLIRQTRLLARAVDTHLNRHDHPHPEIAPVLIFTHPGVHVDSVRPAVRIVQIDGIDRFITNIIQSMDALGTAEIRDIVDVFEKRKESEAELFSEEDFFAEETASAEQAIADAKPVPQLNLPPFLANIRFSTRQWILLAAIALVEVIILVAFIFFVLLTA